MLDRLLAIDALVERDTKMWLTSSMWAALALEVGMAEAGTNPQPGQFEALKFRRLTVVNSGSEDEEMCHQLNRPDAERSGFAWKRDHWMTGKK